MQRLGDQLFADVRAVAVCGVEEVVPECISPFQDIEHVGTVPGRSPDLRPADAHRAKSEAFDLQIADGDVGGRNLL